MPRSKVLIAAVLVALPLLALTGFVAWAENPAEPLPAALQALETSATVEVQTEPWLVFQPAGEQPSTGLIFYPGGRVDPRAYAPAMREIAEAGYLTAIVPMPLNLAFLDVAEASNVMGAYPFIDRWVVGGHSLGGAMAASYADIHRSELAGLVLWAAYPAASDDLFYSRLSVLSVYGSLDGRTTPEKINSTRHLLPSSTRWVEIEGGNHAQFGYYGAQAGDNPAQISREVQQSLAVSATIMLLDSIDGADR